jgi:hypothetical protein
MFANIVRSKSVRVAAVACLVGAVMVVAGQSPSGAAPTTKTLLSTCVGADGPSKELVKVLDSSGQLTLPLDVTIDAPATLQPEQADVPFTFSIGVNLDVATVNKAAPLLPSVDIKDPKFALKISGPTGTTSATSTPQPTKTLPLVAGQPASVAYGPFSSTLTEIGKGGIIKYEVAATTFTIVAAVAGTVNNVNVSCTTPGKAFATSIKIPGSPDITQPIEVKAGAAEQVTVDVLGQFTKPSKDEDGVLREIDASTFKVLDGPGTIVDGKLQVTAGAAGSTTTITCEVCSGSLPGVDDTKVLDLDQSTDILKKGVAFTLKFGDAESPVITFLPPLFAFPKPTNWANIANNYILAPHEMPSAAEIQAALEATPGIGPGNVVVTRDKANDPVGKDRYLIKFVGALGQQEISKQLKLGEFYSMLPQSVKDGLLDLAGSLGDDEGGEEPIPGGLTPDAYRQQLRTEIELAAGTFNFAVVGEKIGVLLAFELSEATKDPAFVPAATAAINNLFTSTPATETVTPGEAPTGICSQAVIDVVVEGTDTAVAGEQITASPSGLGPNSKSGAALAFTG